MSQQNRMKNLFASRPNEWIPLFDIFPIAKQYNARIKELRDSGMDIRNKTQNVNGEKHSWFIFINDKQSRLF